MNALRALVAPLARDGRFFDSVLPSGAHRSSLELLAKGAVDVAAIDCVTYALLRRVRPNLVAGTRVIAETEAVPALPYVTRRGGEVLQLRSALMQLSREVGEALLLTGFEMLPLSAYQPILSMEQAAVRQGYPTLA
jgi:ABC-type phosphate/phosphonate transport system substrate-binding protein